MLSVFLLLGLLIMPFFMPGHVQERVIETFRGEQMGIFLLESSAMARIRSYEVIVSRIIPRDILWGRGVSGTIFVDSQYVLVFAETGIIGLFLFLRILKKIFTQSRRIWKNASLPLYKSMSLGFLTGFIALLFHALTTNTFIIVRIMEPFWFLAAMVMSIEYIHKKRGQEIPENFIS